MQPLLPARQRLLQHARPRVELMFPLADRCQTLSTLEFQQSKPLSNRQTGCQTVKPSDGRPIGTLSQTLAVGAPPQRRSTRPERGEQFVSQARHSRLAGVDMSCGQALLQRSLRLSGHTRRALAGQSLATASTSRSSPANDRRSVVTKAGTDVRFRIPRPDEEILTIDDDEVESSVDRERGRAVRLVQARKFYQQLSRFRFRFVWQRALVTGRLNPTHAAPFFCRACFRHSTNS